MEKNLWGQSPASVAVPVCRRCRGGAVPKLMSDAKSIHKREEASQLGVLS